METPRMMPGILSEATGKKRRGHKGECPPGPPACTVGQDAPRDRYPRARQGPQGPGSGVWPFLGEVSGDTPELDQPVLTLAWNPCGSLDLFFPWSCLGTCLRPTQPCSSFCSHILADSFKELRLLASAGGKVGGKSGRYLTAICRLPASPPPPKKEDAILWRRTYQKPDVIPENRTGQWGDVTGDNRRAFRENKIFVLFAYGPFPVPKVPTDML